MAPSRADLTTMALTFISTARRPGTEQPCPGERLRIAVLVPSYRRPRDLERCLRAVAGQTRRADQVVVAARPEDAATRAVARAVLAQVTLADVDRPGVIAALNAGRRAVVGDVVAITDDDCCPEPEWLETLEREFAADPALGAVGGPDLLAAGPPPVTVPGQVGRIQASGRIVGNHSAGTQREDVHFLKGANMAFRCEVLPGFDERLRGHGAQVAYEMGACLQVRRSGRRVLFSPEVRVRHFPAPRAVGDERGRVNRRPARENQHNEMCVLAAALPDSRAAASILYGLLIGYRSAPGLAVGLGRLVAGPARRTALAEFVNAMAGRLQGLRTAARDRPAYGPAGGERS